MPIPDKIAAAKQINEFLKAVIANSGLRSHVNYNATTGIRRFSQTNGQHYAGKTEVFHGARQRKRIGWDDTYVATVIHHGFRIKILGVNSCREDIGKNLEFISHTDIVPDRKSKRL